jgi:hypothetical protein
MRVENNTNFITAIQLAKLLPNISKITENNKASELAVQIGDIVISKLIVEGLNIKDLDLPLLFDMHADLKIAAGDTLMLQVLGINDASDELSMAFKDSKLVLNGNVIDKNHNSITLNSFLGKLYIDNLHLSNVANLTLSVAAIIKNNDFTLEETTAMLNDYYLSHDVKSIEKLFKTQQNIDFLYRNIEFISYPAVGKDFIQGINLYHNQDQKTFIKITKSPDGNQIRVVVTTELGIQLDALYKKQERYFYLIIRDPESVLTGAEIVQIIELFHLSDDIMRNANITSQIDFD